VKRNLLEGEVGVVRITEWLTFRSKARSTMVLNVPVRPSAPSCLLAQFRKFYELLFVRIEIILGPALGVTRTVDTSVLRSLALFGNLISVCD
jgi:hypothetical protein